MSAVLAPRPAAPPRARSRRRAGGLGLLTAAQILSGSGAWAALLAAQCDAEFTAHAGTWVLTALAAAWSVPPIVLRGGAARLLAHVGPRAIGGASGGAAALLALVLAALRPGAGGLLALMGALGLARALLSPALDTHAAWRRDAADTAADSVWLTLGAAVPLIIGPAFAAAATGPGALGPALGGAGGCYLLAAAAILAVKATRPGPVPRHHAPAATASAAAPPTAVRRMLRLTLLAWLGYGCFGVLEPVFVAENLHGSARTYALLTALCGLGGVPTGLALRRHTALLRAAGTVPLATAAVGATQLAYIATSELPVALLASAGWGAAAGLLGAATRTRLLILSPPEAAGEVMSRWRAAQAAGTLLPLLAVAALAQAAGTRTTLGLISTLTLAGGVASWPRTPPAAAPLPHRASQGPDAARAVTPAPAPGARPIRPTGRTTPEE